MFSENAMQKEIKSLVENNTWVPFKFKWMFKTKVKDKNDIFREENMLRSEPNLCAKRQNINW